MSETLLPSQTRRTSRGMALSREIVVAGTRFSRGSNNYLVNGKVVGEVDWQERLRGARALQQAIWEIYDRYPVGMAI